MRHNPAATFWRAIALAAVLVLGMTAISGWQRASAGPEAALAAAAGVPATILVEMSEFAIEPAALSAPAGVPLTFSVANVGQIEHDFTIVDHGTTEPIAAGGTGELAVEPLEPGEYAVLCMVPGHADSGMSGTLTVGGAATAADPAATADPADPAGQGTMTMTPEQMVAGHEEGIAAFPAATTGKGNVAMAPTVLADGTKEFRLVANEIEWEVAPGEVKEGMAYNEMIPGPRIDVNLGDRIRIVLDNELEVPTALHSHGLIVPNAMDGVPGITQDAIMPGESFTYEFELRNSGTHMYHSHFDSATQVTSGLLGSLIVHDAAVEPPVELDYTMVLNDGPLGFTINGKSFPATEPLVAQMGETIRVRYLNEGLQIHPMHLHGIPQQVVAKDGWQLPQPYTADTVMIAPGERLDVLVEVIEPGTWAYHCHILNHAEGAEGMFGMVTALVVEE